MPVSITHGLQFRSPKQGVKTMGRLARIAGFACRDFGFDSCIFRWRGDGRRNVLLPGSSWEGTSKADKTTIMKATHPLVSIVVPCRNEKGHIEACVRSILRQQSPPGGFEIIVVDGMSDDGTRDILKRLVQKHLCLRVIDNPRRVTPSAMNVGIRAARGRYIGIFGAHTEYASNYICMCLKLLEERPEACGSGGPIVSQGDGVFGRAVAAAMSNPVGIGNAKHRFPGYEGYAEGACFPMFRKEIFDKVGLFDESLVRNQDDEFNFRVARAGGKIFISPRAQCTYYVRGTPSQLFWQYFLYGYYRVSVLRKHRIPTSIRQIVPVAFFPLVVVLLVVGIHLPGLWWLTAGALPTLYTLTLATCGARVAITEGARTGLMFPIAAGIMHLAYTVGFAWGCCWWKGYKKK